MEAKNNRRNFLKLLLTGGAVAALPAGAAGNPAQEPDNKTTLLTEDGRLVEMDKSVLDRVRSGKKAAGKEIRQFLQSDTTTDK